MKGDDFNGFWKHLKEYGSTAQTTSRTAAHVGDVNNLVLSPEGAPQTHHTLWQIARKRGIHYSSVVLIIRDDLRLKCVKKWHAQDLMEANCINHLNQAKTVVQLPTVCGWFHFLHWWDSFHSRPSPSRVNLQHDKCSCPLRPKSMRLTLTICICYALSQHSAQHYHSLVALIWYLLSHESRWMVHTIGMLFSGNRCFLEFSS